MNLSEYTDLFRSREDVDSRNKDSLARSFDEACMLVLEEVVIASTDDIFELIPLSIRETRRPEELVPVLFRNALCVCGMWVLPEKSFADVQKFILSHFHLHMPVNVRFFEKTCGLRDEFVLQILNKFAVRDVETGEWDLRGGKDAGFATRFPSTWEHFEGFWKREHVRLGRLFSSSTFVHRPERIQKKDAADVSFMSLLMHPSDSSGSGMVGQGVGLGGGMSGMSGISGMGGIGGGRSVTAASSICTHDISAVSSGFGLEEGPVREELAMFLRDLFRQHGVCNLACIRQSIEDQGHIDQSGKLDKITEQELSGTIHFLCRSFRNHTSFVLRTTGDPNVDEFRDVIIDLLCQMDQVRKADVKRAVFDKLKKDIPQTLYSRLLKEFATRRGSVWVPKTGNALQ
eukprot:TRINITY_DN12594_c0_g1_i1.p1 TRINITY_DN12594_c0_g1~~TRINITY_DN12594_c0_g1_i1.p1  ORF type:complete len:401 (+),score=115.71 TRINITY_DN12594_c0_g1_i1:225-1427(+)